MQAVTTFGLSLSEIDKAFKSHNTFWLKKDEEIDMSSPVYYLKYSELKLLLRSGFNSERIYCVLTKQGKMGRNNQNGILQALYYTLLLEGVAI